MAEARILVGEEEIPNPRVLRTPEDDDHSQAPTPERRYLVEPPHTGMRMDTFLGLAMPWRSRAANQQLVREGRTSVMRSGHVSRPRKAGRLVAGDVVHVRFPPLEQLIRHAEIAASLEVLYEDEALIAINKPPGLVAHPVGRTRVNTLLNALHHRFRKPSDQDGPETSPILAHRLDRDTSGVCLVARNRDIRRRLQEIFEARKVRKQYLALVHGRMSEDHLEICHHLGHHPHGIPKTLMAVVPGGMPATTRVETRERFDAFSLVRAHPHEGRQHQIRVHLAAVGHPIIADSLYGPGGAGFVPGSLEAAETAPGSLERQALHAEKICLPHPLTGEPLEIEAPCPQDMAHCLERLRSDNATPTEGTD